jgi:hypothetical protein
VTRSRYRIHPAIGIGRVGDAARGTEEGDGWYIGPERPGAPARWDEAAGRYQPFKANGSVMARAVRYRVFEYRDDGAARELRVGGDVERIVWRVQLANRKAAFFKFFGPWGRTTTYGYPLNFLPFTRRNPGVWGRARDKLVMSSESIELATDAATGRAIELANTNADLAGQIPVLGDARLDRQGRLIVCGGHGRAAYLPALNKGAPRDSSLKSFANSNGWFDDIADGPVTATIHFTSGQSVELAGDDGAWFMCAPPDFAPAVSPYRSMWDTLLDRLVQKQKRDLARAPEFAGSHWLDLANDWDPSRGRLGAFRPSFTRDIYPILRSAFGVASLFSVDERPISHRRFEADLIPQLGGAGSSADTRALVFRRIRPPGSRRYDLTQMPLANGDFVPLHQTGGWLGRAIALAARLGVFPSVLATVSPLQYALLHRWAEGQFDEDWQGPPRPPSGVEGVGPLELDRAALESAVGGAFFPGIEASWLFADGRLFGAPLRIRAGHVLRRFSGIGRIAIGPGIATAQMATPWHADFASCKKTKTATGLSHLAWWPTQRPDDVFTRVGGELRPVAWARGADLIEDDATRQLQMVGDWSKYGFVIDEGDGSGPPFEQPDGPSPP